jgi:hypothetical protein
MTDGTGTITVLFGRVVEIPKMDDICLNLNFLEFLSHKAYAKTYLLVDAGIPGNAEDFGDSTLRQKDKAVHQLELAASLVFDNLCLLDERIHCDGLLCVYK